MRKEREAIEIGKVVKIIWPEIEGTIEEYTVLITGYNKDADIVYGLEVVNNKLNRKEYAYIIGSLGTIEVRDDLKKWANIEANKLFRDNKVIYNKWRA